MKVATLLPSATEIVSALGLSEQLVAISHSCSFPESALGLPRVTSTRVPNRADSETIDAFVRSHLAENEALYDLDLGALRTAAPDVIVSQALCDVCAVSTGDVVDALTRLPNSPRLIDLQPHTLEDVLDDIRRVGDALDVSKRAASLVDQLKARIARVETQTAAIPADERPRIAFLEWLMPPFIGGHWNPEVVALAGGVDVLGAAGKPSTCHSWHDIHAVDPDALFIACCGFSVERAKMDIDLLNADGTWTQLRAVNEGRVHVAPGELFSCPGPRLIDGLELLAQTLHPDRFVAPHLSQAG